MLFAEYLEEQRRRLALTDAEGLTGGWAAQLDQLAEDARLAAAYGRPDECPSEAAALDLLARSRGLFRFAAESVEAARDLARSAWEIHRGRGTTWGLLQQLSRLGYPAAEYHGELSLRRAGYLNPFGGTLGFFFLLLRKPHAVSVAAQAAWGDGQLWDGSTTWGGTTITRANIAELAALVRRWKLDGSSCRFAVFELDAAQPVVIGLGAGVTSATGTAEDLYAVFGTSASNVWAVGSNGTILRYDGSAWAAQTSPTTAELRGVWGASAAAAWAVGTGGKIVKWDGANWTNATSGTINGLTGVWGASATDVWAVGTGGTILHWGGVAWTSVASPTAQDLFSVWGSGAADVWAVGTGGTILHYNGASWTVATSGGADLAGVAGTGAADVWAVGAAGRALHFDGVAWTAVDSGVTEDLLDVAAAGPRSVVAVRSGGLPIRWDGSAWRTLQGPAGDYLRVWGGGADLLWTVGLAGLAVRFGAANFSGSALVIPIGEAWEVEGGAIAREFYHYGFLQERAT